MSTAMKTLTGFFLIMFAGSASAFMGSNMEGVDMQKMQANMGKMTACMEKIDNEKLENLRMRGQTIVKGIELLCKDGKRDEAQNKAMAFAKEVRDSPEIAQIRECGKIIEMAPTIPPDFSAYKSTDFENKHVCD